MKKNKGTLLRSRSRVVTMRRKGWIGVDFDGTLARCDFRWHGLQWTGEPIQPMVDRVKQWRAQGWDVRVFTARASAGEVGIRPVEEWCRIYLGEVLPVTNQKDFDCIAIYDDRAWRVEENTGRIIGE